MTDTQQAAHDRWRELQTRMDMDPNVEWHRIYQLITEIHSIRQAGECATETERQMEERRLY